MAVEMFTFKANISLVLDMTASKTKFVMKENIRDITVDCDDPVSLNICTRICKHLIKWSEMLKCINFK